MHRDASRSVRVVVEDVLERCGDADARVSARALEETLFVLCDARTRALARDGSFARALERALEGVVATLDERGGSVSRVRACERCVRASGEALGRKRARRLESALRTALVSRARNGRRERAGDASLEDLPEDVLHEIILRCDARTRAMVACVSKSFRDVTASAPARNGDDALHSFPRAKCRRCRTYRWVCDIPSIRDKCEHQWESSANTWRRDLRRFILDDDEDDSDSDDDNWQAHGHKFWNVPSLTA